METYELEVPEGTIEYVTVVVQHRESGAVFPTNVALGADLQIDTTGKIPLSHPLAMLEATLLTAAAGPQWLVDSLGEVGFDLIIEDEECITPSTEWDWEKILNG